MYKTKNAPTFTVEAKGGVFIVCRKTVSYEKGEDCVERYRYAGREGKWYALRSDAYEKPFQSEVKARTFIVRQDRGC